MSKCMKVLTSGGLSRICGQPALGSGSIGKGVIKIPLCAIHARESSNYAKDNEQKVCMCSECRKAFDDSELSPLVVIRNQHTGWKGGTPKRLCSGCRVYLHGQYKYVERNPKIRGK